MSLNHNSDYNQDIRNWLEKNFRYAQYLSEQPLQQRDCPVCKSKRHQFYLNNDYLNYSKCDDCGLVFMNPTIDDSNIQDGFKGNDEILMDYFNLMKKYKNLDFVSSDIPNPHQDIKLKDIYQFKKTGTLLDVGCSVGDFLHKAKHFYEVEGVEVNPETSKYAQRYFTVHTDYLEYLSLEKKYDIVSLHQILYGVPNTVSLLKDIHKILKDDGILYINTPNADSLAMELFSGKCNHVYGYTSQNIFNKSSLQKLAELSGFKLSFFRTEWLDIYNVDLREFYVNRDKFIHKRNTYVLNYEELIAKEEHFQKEMNMELFDRGNYMVAVLEKV